MRPKRGHPLLLAFILLAHVIVFWMLARSHGVARLAVPERAERITYLLPVLPRVVTPPPTPRPTPRPTPPPEPPAARKPAAQVAPRERTISAPAVVQAEVTPAPVVAAVPVPAPRHLSGAEILEQAKQDMPRIERELRNNVPTKLTLSPESLRYKLEHGIADAYVGGDQRVTVDFYTSPDNVHYMRMTKGGKSWCTMNGGPVTLARANGVGVDRDTKVNCPPAAPMEWKDMPYVN